MRMPIHMPAKSQIFPETLPDMSYFYHDVYPLLFVTSSGPGKQNARKLAKQASSLLPRQTNTSQFTTGRQGFNMLVYSFMINDGTFPSEKAIAVAHLSSKYTRVYILRQGQRMTPEDSWNPPTHPTHLSCVHSNSHYHHPWICIHCYRRRIWLHIQVHPSHYIFHSGCDW